MPFDEFIRELRRYHRTLWFCCPGFGGKDTWLHVKSWRGATIVSATGTLLAFQTGDDFDWQTSARYREPADDPYDDGDASGYGLLLDDEFAQLVTVMQMVMPRREVLQNE